MQYDYDIAVYIGRFQPVHYGHLDTIRQAFANAAYLVIFLGSSQESGTVKNPFTANQRQQMIIESLLEQGYSKKELKKRLYFRLSHDGKEDIWRAEIQSQVDALATELFPNKGADIALIGYYKDDSSYYIKEFPRWSLLEVNPFTIDGLLISATHIRHAWHEDRLENIRHYISTYVYDQLQQKRQD